MPLEWRVFRLSPSNASTEGSKEQFPSLVSSRENSEYESNVQLTLPLCLHSCARCDRLAFKEHSTRVEAALHSKGAQRCDV